MSNYEYHNSTTYFDRHDGESMHQLLASAEDEVTINYATTSSIVITLALVLAVELLRRSVSCSLHFFSFLYLPL